MDSRLHMLKMKLENSLTQHAVFEWPVTKKIDKAIAPHSPGDMCCNICSESCKCGSVGCQQVYVPHEQGSETDNESASSLCRCVTEEDKALLTDAFEAHQTYLSASGTTTALGLSYYSFSTEAICDILDNCHKLFTVDNVISCIPVFSVTMQKKYLALLMKYLMILMKPCC